jgi:polyisoprenoid-binding protein YceI
LTARTSGSAAAGPGEFDGDLDLHSITKSVTAPVLSIEVGRDRIARGQICPCWQDLRNTLIPAR